MLKYEEIASVGDTILAYDFEPFPGREDRYVVGTVTDKGMINGYLGYTIRVIGSSHAQYMDGGGVYVPFETSITEYEGRVRKIDPTDPIIGGLKHETRSEIEKEKCKKDHFECLFEDAVKAAQKAVKDNEHLENENALDCGFAWVVVKPARGPFITWLKKRISENGGERSPGVHRYGSRDDYKGGWMFWKPGSENFRGQSIAVFEAGAKAFAKVLNDNGIKASWSSRLD